VLEFDCLRMSPVLIVLTQWVGLYAWVWSGISLRIRVAPEVAVSHVYAGQARVAALVPDPRLRACQTLITEHPFAFIGRLEQIRLSPAYLESVRLNPSSPVLITRNGPLRIFDTR
jgi:hypothetical protein